MATMTGAEVLMELLRNEGVGYVFGTPGTTELLFLDALQEHPEITYILGLHETVALGIAEGYSRTSGKVGVVNLHTSPGLAAAMPMLLNAYYGEVPLVITAGLQDTRILLQEPRMAGDLVRMASQFTKWSTQVQYAGDIPIAIRRAFKVAAHPPAGPVFIALPQDVLELRTEFEDLPSVPYFAKLHAGNEAISKAAELLVKCQNPALIVGNGVAKSEALAEVVHLAELVGAAVYHPVMSDVDFPTNHPQYLGHLDVTSLNTREILQSVDVLVVIGAQLFSHLSYLPQPLLSKNTRIIQIDNNPWEIAKNFPVAVGIEGDIKASVAALSTVLEKLMPVQAHEAAKVKAREISTQKEKMATVFRKKVQQESDSIPISVSRLMQELKVSLKPGTVIVDDSFSCSPILRRMIDFIEPKSYHHIRGGGSIGWGMGGAIGAKIGIKDRPVVAVVGDGSAIWSIQSLWTAAHYDIPVTYIICANASYRQVKNWKKRWMGEKAKGRYLGLDFDKPRIDFCQLARAMGVHGQKADQPNKLRDVLKSALELGKPALVEVEIESAI